MLEEHDSYGNFCDIESPEDPVEYVVVKFESHYKVCKKVWSRDDNTFRLYFQPSVAKVQPNGRDDDRTYISCGIGCGSWRDPLSSPASSNTFWMGWTDYGSMFSLFLFILYVILQ
jgi:hypothetical protein